jgi:hypothetical protein
MSTKFFLVALATAVLSAKAMAAPGHFARPPDAAGAVAAPTLDRATVRAQLAKARAMNLARFRAYQQKATFPSNTYRDGKLNVWRDRDGHLCAAATIIDASGARDLVARVAQDDNFIRLADVVDGPLMDWMLVSGFTQEEIAAIQEPFVRVREEPSQTIVAQDRRTEDARLAKRYTEVTRMLVANADSALDVATDRLMQHADLARKLVTAR